MNDLCMIIMQLNKCILTIFIAEKKINMIDEIHLYCILHLERKTGRLFKVRKRFYSFNS